MKLLKGFVMMMRSLIEKFQSLLIKKFGWDVGPYS